MADNKKVLTHSQMQCAKTCFRKHQFSYIDGFRPDTSHQVLRFGQAFHIGLDVYKDSCKDGHAKDLAITAAFTAYDESKPAGMDAERQLAWQVEREQLIELLNGYFWRWKEMDKGIETIASEMQFELPITNPETGRSSRTYTVAGKVDGIIRLADGRRALIEHKTCGHNKDISPTSDLWKQLRIDSQISLYMNSVNQMGYDVEVIVYDVIRKPGISPKKLTQADTKAFIETGEYCGQMFEVLEAREPLPGCTRFVVDEVAAESEPGKKEGTFTIRETPDMYAVRLRQDIGDRPDFYFVRREIPRTKYDLEESRQDVWHMAKLLGDCTRHGRWPRNSGQCTLFGRCPYFDLCTDGFDPETVPAGFIKVDNVHQELELTN